MFAMLLSHISIQCADLEASAQFYDAVLAPLGAKRIHDFAPHAIGYGKTDPVPMPQFWIGPQETGEGFRETHIAFMADNRDQVDKFFAEAIRVGAVEMYAPKLWPEYGPGYYGAFVRDPDGNNVEACVIEP